MFQFYFVYHQGERHPAVVAIEPTNPDITPEMLDEHIVDIKKEQAQQENKKLIRIAKVMTTKDLPLF